MFSLSFVLLSRWSLIAGRVPGRTDNQVKNHWNTHLSKRLGFKKGKGRADDSPRTSLKKEENQAVALGSSPNQPSGDHLDETAQKIAGDDESSQRALECNSSQQLIAPGNEFQNPFWFFNDGLNLYSPDFLEHLDEYALDLVFDGL